MQSLLSLMLTIVTTVLCWTKIMMMSSGTTQSLSRGKLSPCNQCSVVVSMESGCSIHKRHRIDGSVVQTNEQLVVTNTILVTNTHSAIVSMESGCSIHRIHRIDGSVVQTNEQLVVTNTIFIITDVVPSVQTQHHRTERHDIVNNRHHSRCQRHLTRRR